jgi:hypothetical protein
MPQRSRDVSLNHALLHFCAEYHSGQWSRGYRILCAVKRRMRRWGWQEWERQALDIPLSVEGKRIYNRLVKRYGGKV